MAMDDSKTALGLGSVSNTVTSIISDVQRLAGVVETTLLPKVQAVARSMSGIHTGLVDTKGQPLTSQNKIADTPGTPTSGAPTAAGVNNNSVANLPPIVRNVMGEIGRAHV